jgi:hypothetical protein
MSVSTCCSNICTDYLVHLRTDDRGKTSRSNNVNHFSDCRDSEDFGNWVWCYRSHFAWCFHQGCLEWKNLNMTLSAHAPASTAVPNSMHPLYAQYGLYT